MIYTAGEGQSQRDISSKKSSVCHVLGTEKKMIGTEVPELTGLSSE